MIADENYPTQYESWFTLKDGREVFIRPILQTDENLIVDLFKKLSPHSIYLRFLGQLHDLPRDLLYQFTHINYHSDFALAGIIKEENQDAIVGTARYAYSSPDNHTELAVTVRDDWQHFGLGKSLLQRIVAIGKEHGIYCFGGMINPQNKIMMQMLAELGYKVEYSLRNGVFQVMIFV